jgi:uncharacterized membrane protein YhaH (DUF805 family)
MNIGDAVRVCLKKYATFDGRASRPEYWWFVLAVVVVTGIVSFVSEFLAGLVYLALLLPILAAAARRLHDIGKSAWLLLIGLIPLIGGLILLYFHVLRGNEGSNEYGEPPSTSG